MIYHQFGKALANALQMSKRVASGVALVATFRESGVESFDADAVPPSGVNEYIEWARHQTGYVSTHKARLVSRYNINGETVPVIEEEQVDGVDAVSE